MRMLNSSHMLFYKERLKIRVLIKSAKLKYYKYNMVITLKVMK